MLCVVHAYCPGRICLIGDHTDYNAGVALPMAIDLGVEVTYAPDDTQELRVSSSAFEPPATIPVDQSLDPVLLAQVSPPWARRVAAIVALARPPRGGTITVCANLPAGAGLASSAALSVALTLALGVEGPPISMAVLCQQAETSLGAPVGLLDPLACLSGREGHALLIDFATLGGHLVPVPPEAEIVVVCSGEQRSLERTAYAARRAECAAAAVTVGPLGHATAADVEGLRDRVLRRRVRHVVTECERVHAYADALASGDLVEAGQLMSASHRSLAEDFEVSTPGLDALVAHLVAMPGVHGARLTGAGFGGCVVALTDPGAVDPERFRTHAWRLRPSDGAARLREGVALTGRRLPEITP